MALNSYNGIKAAIASYLGQDNLTSQLDIFIDICESRIFFKVRLRRMETFTTKTTTAGSDIVTLPDHFRGIRSIYVDGDPQYSLEYLSPEQLNNVANTSGRPKYYTIRGNSILFPGAADDAYNLKIHYVARFDKLSGSNSSNWIVETKPEVYLYGCLQAACEFTGDTEAAANYGRLFDQALFELQRSDDYEKYGSVPVMKTEGIRW